VSGPRQPFHTVGERRVVAPLLVGTVEVGLVTPSVPPRTVEHHGAVVDVVVIVLVVRAEVASQLPGYKRVT